MTHSVFDSVMLSNLIMQQSIMQEKLKHRPPTLYLRPAIHDIRVLDFDKADTIYEQTAPARDTLKRKLVQLLQPGII